MVGGESITISASVGLTVSTHGYTQPEQMLRDADIAMYRAKHQGRARSVTFDPTMHTALLERLRDEDDLQAALARDEFELHYQPIIATASRQIVGVEALLRWHHPTRGLIPPASFIPLAEELGVIVPLGTWVLRTACQQIKAWHAQGLPAIFVAVNVAAPQFKHHLGATIVEILGETGLDPTFLELELTERILMDDVAATSSTLHDLATHRIHALAVDDFGTGYSSLSYLQRFPITSLKIDRSFVHDVVTNVSNAAIVAAIIALAQQLKLTTVAEGVETEAQAQFLQAHGCDHLQGYLFSRPVPAAEIPALLALDQPGATAGS